MGKLRVRHVVSISPAEETPDFDEAAASRSLGLNHHQLSIRSPADLTPATVVALDRVLTRIGVAPTLLHCASGNRVGALMALRAGWLQGMTVDAAVRIGRAHGLTRLEAEVRRRLSDRAAAAQARESAGSRTES